MPTRQNTPGVGVEYEAFVPAYIALKLNNNEDVKDFSIRSNVEIEFGNMDDAIIDIEMKDNTRQGFAIQLKHREKKEKRLIPANFEAKGNFSVEKYCKAFTKLKDQIKKDYHFILYTNSEYNSTSREQLKNFRIIEDEDEESPGRSFLDTSCGSSGIYRFEVNDKTPSEGTVTKEDYEEFFPKFKVYVGQKNFEDLEEEIFGILRNRSAVLRYLDLFRRWHQGRFTNKMFDRKTLNLHLIDIFLCDFVITDRQLSIGQNSNLELFQKIVRQFDVTVINDLKENVTVDCKDSGNLVMKSLLEKCIQECKIEGQKLHDDPEATLLQCMLYLGKKYKILDRTTQQLDDCSKKKILHYFFEELLFIDFNQSSEESVYGMFGLYQKTGNSVKFVLLGQDTDSSRFSRLTVFKNLENLRNCDGSLYLQVVQKCELSLQGKDRITLEEMVHSCGHETLIGVKEVLRMLQGDFVIGGERAILPAIYINRRVSTYVLHLATILDPIFVSYNTLIINFCGQLEQIRNKFEENAIDVITLEDFRKLQGPPQNPTVISVSEELSMPTFQEISKIIFTGNLVHLQMTETNIFVPVILKMHDRACFREMVIEEDEVRKCSHRVNILCAQPGMGKSTLFKTLQNQLAHSWTVLVDLKAHNMFLRTKRPIQKVLTYFIEDTQDAFVEKVKTAFFDRKKMVFFFDGLDELESQCIDHLVDYVEEISNLGLQVWVSSRQNLHYVLTSRFSKYAIDIVEISEDEQKQYIEDRLCDDYEGSEIQELTAKIFGSSDMVNNRQVLGVPLQLYIITQIFLDDKEQFVDMTKNIFVLTKMYEFYFEGRYKHTTDKQESKNPHLMIAEPDDHFEKYEILALQSLFDDDVFIELGLDTRRSRRFLQDIKKKKDPLGIVVKVNNENKAIFDHYSYAEYFACAFLANNFDKVRILKERIFSDRYKNLLLIFNVMLAEDNPLHLAVIYKDLDQIQRHREDVNIYDRGGRSPLHLAVSNCGKYPGCITLLDSQWSFSTSTFLQLADTILETYKILTFVIKFDPLKYDKLFEWNCLDYIFFTRSLIAVELILSKFQLAEEVVKYVDKYKEDPPFLSFCTLSGSVQLLAATLGDNPISDMTAWLRKSCVHDAVTYCYFHKMEMLSFLLNHGAPVDFVHGDLTPLQLATRKKFLQVVRLLTAFGANVHVTSPNGDTLLHLCIEDESARAVRHVGEIIAHKDNGDFGASCLLMCKKIDLLGFLLEEGLSINSKNHRGATPLHLAVRRSDLEVVQYLCDNGADVTDVDDDGQTSLHLAAEKSNTEILDLVLDKVSDVNMRNGKGETALQTALANDNTSAVTVLLNRGATSD